jgi:hypothetical protein
MAEREDAGGDIDPGRLAAAHGVTLIISCALISSVAVYVLVGEVVAVASPLATPPAHLPVVRWVFYAVAAALLLAVPPLRRLLLSDRALAARRRLTPAARPEQQAAAVLMPVTIVSLGLSEAVAILGLALAFQSHARWDLYPFAGLGLVSMIAWFPRYAQWEALARRFARMPGPGR